MNLPTNTARTLAFELLFMGFAATGIAFADSNFPNVNQTPIGAEKGANRNGTIPEWTGGLIKPPKGYTEGGHHPDPFRDDTIIHINFKTMNTMEFLLNKMIVSHMRV